MCFQDMFGAATPGATLLVVIRPLQRQDSAKGSFVLPLHTKGDPHVLNNIKVTAVTLPCLPYIGMDVMQCIQ